MSDQDPRTITAVMHGIVGNVEDLVHAQVRLAKAELVDAAQQTGRAAKLLGAGAALAQISIAFILFAGVTLLATVVALWAAALIVGAAVGIVAVVLIAGGADRLRQIGPSTFGTLASTRGSHHG